MIIYGVQNIDAEAIVKAVNRKHKENTVLVKLLNYYQGEQDILLRHYDDPAKPNNRIVVNYCKHIADFLTAYLVGIPVKMKGASERLQTVLDYNDEAESVQRAVTYMNICGFSCELFYVDEDGNPRYSPLNPLECIVFMNDDLQRDITGFIRMVKRDENLGGYDLTVYTATTKQDFVIGDDLTTLTAVSEQTPHYWRDVPVNFYENGEPRQGSFEQIIPMQDALNKVYSDNANDFEQFVDSFLVLEGMQGTTDEDISRMKSQRVLLVDKDSKAYWLTKSVNKDHIKQLQDNLQARILEMGNCPDLQELTGSYGDTSGVSIRMKLIKTEIEAARQENSVRKALLRKVELLYNILNLTGDEADYTAVEPIFTRNFLMTDEEQYKADGGDRWTTTDNPAG